MSKLIYIADDEQNIRELISTFLENEGYCVEAFSDGKAVMQAIELRMPDMLILDIMMPGEDGLAICAKIRRQSSLPIIIVSAKDSPTDRISGITLGSDDYLTKPFLPLELVARVKALFRRAEYAGKDRRQNTENEYCCGNLSLYISERKALIGKQAFPLTPMEFDFLFQLMKQKGAAVSKRELLEQVWKYQESTADVRVTDDLVKRLRKKLRESGATAAVESVWGYGYRICEKDMPVPDGVE